MSNMSNADSRPNSPGAVEAPTKLSSTARHHPRFRWLSLRHHHRGLLNWCCPTLPIKYFVYHPMRHFHLPSMGFHIPWDHFKAHPLPATEVPPLSVRLLVAFCCVFMIFGPNVAYALPGALSDAIQHEYNVSAAKVTLLFSIYSLPNIFLVFFGGIVTDRLGLYRTLMLTSTLFLVGNLIPLLNSFPAMLAGRLVYSVGFETLGGVVQSKILASWFKFDRQIPFSSIMGVCLSAYRASGFTSMILLPRVGGLTHALWLVAGLCFASYVCCVVLAVLGVRYAGYQLALEAREDSSEATGARANSSEHESDKKDPSICYSLRNIVGLFWGILLFSLALYAAVVSFVPFSSEFLRHRFPQYSEADASTFVSYMYLTAVGVLPVAGLIIDRFGHRVTAMIIAGSCLVVGFLLLLYSSVSPGVGCMFLGLGYAIGPCTIFGSIPLVVRYHRLGIAYGLLACALNLGCFAYPVAVASITSNSVTAVEGMLALSVAATLSALALRYAGWRYFHSALEMTIIAAPPKPAVRADADPIIQQGHADSAGAASDDRLRAHGDDVDTAAAAAAANRSAPAPPSSSSSSSSGGSAVAAPGDAGAVA